MFQEQLNYGMARHRDMLREVERRRSGVYEDGHLFNVWEALRQTTKRMVRSYKRRVDPCLKLQPACEMGIG